MATIPFKCPSCGSTEFKASAEIKSYDDLVGVRCSKCDHVVSDEDIKSHARGIADAMIKKAFKDGRT